MSTPADIDKLRASLSVNETRHWTGIIAPCPGRKVLWLENWGIPDRDLVAIFDLLRRRGEYDSIQALGLCNTGVSDWAVFTENLPPQLIELDVRLTHVSPTGVQRLRHERPKLILRR